MEVYLKGRWLHGFKNSSFMESKHLQVPVRLLPLRKQRSCLVTTSYSFKLGVASEHQLHFAGINQKKLVTCVWRNTKCLPPLKHQTKGKDHKMVQACPQLAPSISRRRHQHQLLLTSLTSPLFRAEGKVGVQS